MSRGLVSVIIVNWNGLHFLKDCLPHLYKSSYKNFEVILVDNGSKDGSIEFVKKNYHNIIIVQNSVNKGFAEANNQGYKKAKGEFILLLNNDTKVSRNFMEPLIHALQNDKWLGGVQSKILSMDNPKLLDSVASFFTSTGMLYHYGYHQKDSKKYSKRIYTYTAKGACLMLKREVVEKVGLFDSRFFAYFEESDLCHRIWLSGYKVEYIPESIIHHKIGGTSNSMQNSFIQFHSFKNRINSYIKNLGVYQLMLVLPVHLVICELIAIAFIFKGRVDLFLAIHRAFVWNIMHIKETLIIREQVQKKIRSVKDEIFFPLIKKDPEFSYYYSLFTKSLVGYKDKNIL